MKKEAWPSKVLVTGANGFVGTALCDAFATLGIPHVAAVRTRSQPSEFETGGITPATDWSKALAGCDTIVHLAGRVHVMHDTAADPLEAFRAANVEATLNLARHAARLGVKRFVFLSSVKVNGEETAGRPFTVFDAPAPADPYGQSKLEAEMALRALSRDTGPEVAIIRPPLVYGPGVQANFLRLMQLVKWGVPLPLGAIHNKRSLVALDNLVDAIITCSHHPKAPGEVFFVSDDHDVSTTELLRMIASAMGRRSLLASVPAGFIAGCATLLGQSAISKRLLGSLQVDITHTKSTLGWKPVIGTQAAVEKTVAHFIGTLR